MTAAQPAKSNWGNPQDWASIIGGAGQGAAEGFRGAAQQANTKKEEWQAIYKHSLFNVSGVLLYLILIL